MLHTLLCAVTYFKALLRQPNNNDSIMCLHISVIINILIDNKTKNSTNTILSSQVSIGRVDYVIIDL